MKFYFYYINYRYEVLVVISVIEIPLHVFYVNFHVLIIDTC